MKNLSTVLFVSLVGWASINMDFERKTTKVKLDEIKLNFEDVDYVNELKSAKSYHNNTITLEEYDLNIENSDYLEELEFTNTLYSTTLEEIPVSIENQDYLDELENLNYNLR